MLQHDTGNQDVAVNAFYSDNTYEEVYPAVNFLTTSSLTLNFDPIILDVNEISASILNFGNTKYTQVIGDGATTEFDISHNYNTREIMVFVRESGSLNEQVIPDAELTDKNHNLTGIVS